MPWEVVRRIRESSRKIFQRVLLHEVSLGFFLMIVMCQKLLDRHEKSSEGMRFSDGCEMVHGRGAKNSRRQPIAKYLKGGASGDWIHSDFQFLLSF